MIDYLNEKLIIVNLHNNMLEKIFLLARTTYFMKSSLAYESAYVNYIAKYILNALHGMMQYS